MGTASTMTSAAEAMGLTLSGAASIPAPDSRHAQMATLTGKRIVEMVWEDLLIRDVVDARAIDNAVTTVLALGGSTNAIPHLIAIARRAGVPLDLARFDELARRTPVIANIRPSGKFLMEDFYYAGGLRGMMSRLTDLLDTTAITVEGRTLGEGLQCASVYNDDVIRPRDKPLVEHDGRSAAWQSGARWCRDQTGGDGAPSRPPYRARGRIPRLQRHGRAHRRSRARSQSRLGARAAKRRTARRSDSRNGSTADSKKLLKEGVRDMVRISDARMSGTSYGACVLHVAPESPHRRAAPSSATAT
jgi:dihydroxy-acid dehydratase